MLDLQDSWLPYLTISLVFLSFMYFIFQHYLQSQLRKSKTPCPESYPVIGNLIGFLKNRHRFHDWVAEMLSSTPNLTLQVNGFLNLSHGICTANPTNVNHILHSNFSNYIKVSRFQSVLHDFLGHGIFNADGELWSTQRKIASHEFKTNSLKQFISRIVQLQLSDRLVPYLSFLCDNQQVFDLQDVLQRFGFYNICSLAFGVDPGWLDSNKMKNESRISSFANAFDFVVEVSSNRLMLPVAAIWKMKRLINIGKEKKYKEAVKVMNDYAMNIITEKENVYKKNKESKEIDENLDLLSRFMDSITNFGFHDQDEKRKFLRDIVISFILAGKDSTSTALTWFFWLIADHPRYDRLIHDELQSIISTSGRDSPKYLSYDELKKLHFLQATLTETLRLFPPVPINSRLTVSSDTLPDGTFVGKAWFADYSAYAMGRMEKLWGADCREFKPERWLDSNGMFQPCDQYKFPVFHCGPRMCLGKEMAYVQMKSVAATLLYKFKVVAVNGGGCQDRLMNPPYTLSLLLKMKGGFHVSLKRR